MTLKKLIYSLFVVAIMTTVTGICAGAADLNHSTEVMPEIPTNVDFSNRDVNRITCPGGESVKDVVYSKEKGITVKIAGDNVFVKFLIEKDPATGKSIYIKKPVEMYVVCGNQSTIYTLIFNPRDVPARFVRLVGDTVKIKKNVALFKDMSVEKAVIMMIKKVYANDIPESFTIQKANRRIDVFRDIDVLFNRMIIAEGEGIRLKEYVIQLKESYNKDQMKVVEKYFLIPELAQNPIGVALETLTLLKNKPTRLFVVENKNTDS